MNDLDFRSFVRSERQRLIRYVRSLLQETAELDAEDVVHDVLKEVTLTTDTPSRTSRP